MDYRALGRSGLKVSPMCLGTMNFDDGDGGRGGFGVCGEAEAGRIIGAFLDAGHNMIDTADGYNGGASEEVVGRAIRGRRDEVVLATKAATPTGPGPNGEGLSRANLTRALEASLRRLGTDHVDLYQCHRPDPGTPIEETMATLDGFVRSGKVRYIGCSNFAAGQIVEAQWAAERIGGAPFVSLQSQYSLLGRDIEAEAAPVAVRHGLGIMAWSPLAGGVLAGRYRRGVPPADDSRIGLLGAREETAAKTWAADLLSDHSFDVAEAVEEVAAALGSTPAAVALAWVAGRPGVASVVTGPRNVAQYEQNLAGFSLELPPELAARLEEVSGPTPRVLTGMPA